MSGGGSLRRIRLNPGLGTVQLYFTTLSVDFQKSITHGAILTSTVKT